MNEAISTIMTTRLVTLSPQNTLQDARKIFRENRFHHMPVCTNGRLEGVVSSFDLLKINQSPDVYDQIKVMDVMTRKLAVLNPTDKIGAASIVLLQNRFHSIPVVDEDRKLVGILTTFDLLKYQYQKEYPGDDFPF